MLMTDTDVDLIVELVEFGFPEQQKKNNQHIYCQRTMSLPDIESKITQLFCTVHRKSITLCFDSCIPIE